MVQSLLSSCVPLTRPPSLLSLFFSLLAEIFSNTTDLGKLEWETQRVCPSPSSSASVCVHLNSKHQHSPPSCMQPCSFYWQPAEGAVESFLTPRKCGFSPCCLFWSLSLDAVWTRPDYVNMNIDIKLKYIFEELRLNHQPHSVFSHWHLDPDPVITKLNDRSSKTKFY